MKFEKLNPEALKPVYDYNVISANIQRVANESIRQAAYEKSAKHVFDVIIKEVKTIEDTLDNDHEAAVKFASFGELVLMNVEKINYREPHFIYFYGSVNGQPASLIQHISQLSFLVIVVKTETERPSRRIGFYCDQPAEE